MSCGFALLAAAGRHPGAELERAELLLGQRRPAEGVVLVLDDQMPAEHGELAGGRDDRDLHPAARADSLIEGAQRPGGADGDPGRFDEHPAGVRAAVLGDPPVPRRLTARLPDPRVQPEIRHQPAGGREPVKVADGRHDRQRHGGVDPGDRHQPLDLPALQRDTSERGVDDPQLLPVEVELAQQRLDGELLIRRQRLVRQPAPALDPEQIRHRRLRDQVALQDRLYLILDPRPLPDQMRAPSDLPAQRLRVLVGHPHRRQVVSREQLREDRRVDLVGLDLRLGDRPRLHRVRDHHPRHPRGDQLHDRVRVTRRLDRDLIRRQQTVREHPNRLGRRRDLPRLANHTVLPHRDLSELAMHIQTDPAWHCSALLRVDRRLGEQAGKRQLRIRARSASG